MTGKGVRQETQQVRHRTKVGEGAAQHPGAQCRSGDLTAGLNSQLRCCGCSNSAGAKSHKINLHGEQKAEL